MKDLSKDGQVCIAFDHSELAILDRALKHYAWSRRRLTPKPGPATENQHLWTARDAERLLSDMRGIAALHRPEAAARIAAFEAARASRRKAARLARKERAAA